MDGSETKRKQKQRKLAKEAGLKRLYVPEVWLNPLICKELELKIAVLIASHKQKSPYETGNNLTEVEQ